MYAINVETSTLKLKITETTHSGPWVDGGNVDAAKS